MRESLDDIALACAADKSSACHGYAAIYDPWFVPLRDKPIVLLEIGVGGGHSLKMWERYFTHPDAEIFGLDNDPQCALAFGFSPDGKVAVFTGDQRKDEDLARLLWSAGGALDVVIDDGSHRWGDQQFTFSRLWPHVRPGGQYWIEDLHTSYWQSHNDGAEMSTVAMLQNLVDEVQMYGKPPEGPDCRADRKASLRFAIDGLERSVEELHFWKGLALVKKQCS
jgi:hypothetical protein